MEGKPIAAGKSSFDLIEARALFQELPLEGDPVFLDVACGAGAYSLAVAELLGADAEIFAFDLWSEGIEMLNREIEARQIKKIQAGVADVTQSIPLDDACVDVCLLATVLHDFLEIHAEKGALSELKRVVRPGGTLAVVEFKVMDGPPGPPRQIRISAQRVQELVVPHGFRLLKIGDIGPYNYLCLFQRED
jgi:ubiquinone/menaquinone biosynthesis C-methylase UbiE